MSEDAGTQTLETESSQELPGEGEGLFQENLPQTEETPQELPEEYKPYSQFPWHEIPEEARPAFLEKLKKFHGDMTRTAQEAAEIRKVLPELQQKAEFVDRLVADPRFMEWYNKTVLNNGETQEPKPAPDTSKLNEVLEPEAVSALQQLIRSEIEKATKPISEQLSSVSSLSMAEKAERELRDLRSRASQNQWPEVDNFIPQMRQILESGRATTLEDAYFLAAKEDLLKAETQKALKNQRSQLERKAETTFAPTSGPAKAPDLALFSGEEATIKALEEAERELRQQGKL